MKSPYVTKRGKIEEISIMIVFVFFTTIIITKIQAAFVVDDLKNNSIYQLSYEVRAIAPHIVFSIVASKTIYISDKCLNSQIKKLLNKKVL
jgi:hypothetical protein